MRMGYDGGMMHALILSQGGGVTSLLTGNLIHNDSLRAAFFWFLLFPLFLLIALSCVVGATYGVLLLYRAATKLWRSPKNSQD